jgi:hypothetical protein
VLRCVPRHRDDHLPRHDDQLPDHLLGRRRHGLVLQPEDQPPPAPPASSSSSSSSDQAPQAPPAFAGGGVPSGAGRVSRIAAQRALRGLPRLLLHDGLRGYTRARCYSPLEFLVTMGILHTKEIREGQ